jgi:bifunctional UDP-N-acetylglucosamine pyrophosphorylase/glucosamine-1-phosphate N-acetyltransferase
MPEGIRPVVLAAGKGTRMRSELPKALHRLAGRPMLGHVLAAIEAAGLPKPLCVIGYGGELVEEYLGARADVVWQRDQLGTGDAVRHALQAAEAAEWLLVLNGDLPLLRGETLQALVRESGPQGGLLAATVPDPHGYGRIERTPGGDLGRIVEDRDCDESQREIREINVGAYLLPAAPLRAALGRVGTANAQGEIYFVDAVTDLARAGRLAVVEVPAAEAAQVNDRRELAVAEAVLRRRQVERLMLSGVTVLDPATTYVDATVEVGRDSVLHPFTFLEGETRLGEGCEIGPQVRLLDSVLGDDCKVSFSVLEETTLGAGTSCGPFTHLRPGTRTGKQVSIGNFVEMKGVEVGDQTKVRHHSYLGDASIGRHVNIGAGTVIVNYDGRRKHHTRISDGAFIGCNANLIAPVEIGREGYVAAGSTINQNVPDDALAVARERQRNIEGWVAKRKAREE